MSEELAKIDDDLNLLNKLKLQGHDCDFFIDLIKEYRNRIKEDENEQCNSKN